MAITKISGQGEQLVIDVSQWNGVTGEIVHETVAEMSQLFDEALALADLRLGDMNTRMLEAYEMQKYFDPASWQKVTQILDILAGRVSAAQVVQRWEATIEENRELAAMRETAHNVNNGKVEYVNSDYDDTYEIDPNLHKIIEQNRIQDIADETVTVQQLTLFNATQKEQL